MEKKELLYEGKAKKMYTTEDADILIQVFKDDASAFDGKKKDTIAGKGEYNCSISGILFDYLESYNISTHFIKKQTANEMVVKRTEAIPLEAVMRNVATGSLVKRLPFKDSTPLDYPVFEFYLKNDDLGDPLVNDYHIFALQLATPEELRFMFRQTSKINAILKSYLERRDMVLVDFKLEFGRHKEGIILIDEISPDTCRFWDRKTSEKMDKDRFRFDMGGVEDAYKEVLDRLSNL